MNTSNSSAPRALAHRLTTVGHALHERLFAQLHDSGIHPKTLLLLGAIDGRIDAPWVADRLARGGKRLTALADRGWIAREDDRWSLTDEGRALLDRVDAERAGLLADVTPEHLANLTAGLDALAKALDIDETAAHGPRGGFRVVPGLGRRGFGPDPRRAFGPNEHHGFRVGDRPGPRRPFAPAAPETPEAPEHGQRERGEHSHRGGSHECGGGPRPHRRRGEQHAFERGFDAGFQRGREACGAESDPRA